MSSPWTIVAGLLLAISLVGGGYYKGHKNGANEQAANDQKLITAANDRMQGIIDGYNIQIADQKAIATKKAIEQRDQVIALQTEREKFKKQLGEQHVKNQDLTNSLHRVYSAYSLRFRVEPESAGCGYGAGSCEGAEGRSSGNACASIVQLPEALTRDLRQLAKDADELNDDYKLCHGFSNGEVKASE